MKAYIGCGILALALLTGCATGTQPSKPKVEVSYNNLPIPVQNTIKNRAENAAITGIDKESLYGSPVYEVSLAEPSGKNRKLRVAEDGSVITTQDWIWEKSGAARVNPESLNGVLD